MIVPQYSIVKVPHYRIKRVDVLHAQVMYVCQCVPCSDSSYPELSFSLGGRGNFTYLLEGQIHFAPKLSVGGPIKQF